MWSARLGGGRIVLQFISFWSIGWLSHFSTTVLERRISDSLTDTVCNEARAGCIVGRMKDNEFCIFCFKLTFNLQTPLFFLFLLLYLQIELFFNLMNDFVALFEYFLLPMTYLFVLTDINRTELDFWLMIVIIAEKNFVFLRINSCPCLCHLKLTFLFLNIVEFFSEKVNKFS